MASYLLPQQFAAILLAGAGVEPGLTSARVHFSYIFEGWAVRVELGELSGVLASHRKHSQAREFVTLDAAVAAVRACLKLAGPQLRFESAPSIWL